MMQWLDVSLCIFSQHLVCSSCITPTLLLLASYVCPNALSCLLCISKIYLLLSCIDWILKSSCLTHEVESNLWMKKTNCEASVSALIHSKGVCDEVFPSTVLLSGTLTYTISSSDCVRELRQTFENARDVVAEPTSISLVNTGLPAASACHHVLVISFTGLL